MAKNNPPVAPSEVVFECPIEQLGDQAAIVAECSTTPCPQDNGIVSMLHPDGQNFENAHPHGRAYFPLPLGDHLPGVDRRAGDDSNRVRIFEKAAVIGAKDRHLSGIDCIIRVKRIPRER